MKTIKKTISIVLCVILIIAGCSPATLSQTEKNSLFLLRYRLPLIVREEAIANFKFPPFSEANITDIDDTGSYQFDLRDKDVSHIDFSKYQEELRYVLFSPATIWPESLPGGFDPQQIMEYGKNPGLGVRDLHDLGITGEGVRIAIIDQALMAGHIEYSDNLMFYERINSIDEFATIHGGGVTSIATGQTTGVAPGAQVFYIATSFGRRTQPDGPVEDMLENMAICIERIIEINSHLPKDQRIRVISISRGFDTTEPEGVRIKEVIDLATSKGIFVITTSTMENYNFQLMGLGREMQSDPDDLSSYGPGLFWYENADFVARRYDRMLYVPMDARTTASFMGEDYYGFCANTGLSWACPWLAGMFALCLQVNPDLEIQEFIDLAFETGSELEADWGDETVQLKVIVNPAKLIEAVANEPLY